MVLPYCICIVRPTRQVPIQFLPAQEPLEQQPELYFIENSRVSGGISTGIGAELLAVPFILTPIMALLKMANPRINSMISPSGTTCMKNEAVTCPICPTCPTLICSTTPVPVQQPVTPCIPSTCPEGYQLLQDQSASPNCFLSSGDKQAPWCNTLVTCIMTPGAYLWRPNTEEEARAVLGKFGLPDKAPVWTGANDLKDQTDNFSFAVENSPLDFNSLPFGTDESQGGKCVGMRLEPLEWGAIACNFAFYSYANFQEEHVHKAVVPTHRNT